MSAVIRNTATLIFTLILISIVAFAQKEMNTESVLGFWLSENGNETIEIYKVGDKYHGKIVHMVSEYDDEGNLRVDNNPDEELNGRRLVGIELLEGFSYSGNGYYTGGMIYDPVAGKKYRARIRMTSPTTAKVRGYLGLPMFGRTELVTKVEEPTK